MTPKTIKDYISPLNGFIKHMEFEFELVTKEQLDLLFYANYGNKNPAPVFTNIVSDIPTEMELKKLANFTLMFYKTKWQKIFSTYKIRIRPYSQLQR